jgi:hypothetical protein
MVEPATPWLNKKNTEKAKFLCTEIKDLHNRSHAYPQVFPAGDFCGGAPRH